MNHSLDVILDLVGTLDDSPGDDTARERFRNYLEREVKDVGHARDLIEECLRKSGIQYARALQDLVNYVGHFLGFEVEHGRYQGVPGEIGRDGLWTSPTGFHIVLETKTTEQFHIKTSALTGYVNELISEQRISDWKNAMGLYVIGDPDPEVQQLRNAIVAENKTDQLRTISVDALLSLAELLSEYDVSHEDALAVLRPSGPSIDPIANPREAGGLRGTRFEQVVVVVRAVEPRGERTRLRGVDAAIISGPPSLDPKILSCVIAVTEQVNSVRSSHRCGALAQLPLV